MQSWSRLALMIAGLTLLPIVPFILLGGDFEQTIEAWFADQRERAWIGVTCVSLLAVDIFLPIPSSVICTLAGSRLGWLTGGLLSWLGLNLGTLAGYGLAYRYGSPLARRWSNPADLQQAGELAERYGALTLVLTRGLPILGEAMVLVMGVYRLSWWRFCLPVAASNLGLSMAYTALGHWASATGWLPLAVGIAAGLPLLPLLFIRRGQPSIPDSSLNRSAPSKRSPSATTED